ncbi:CHASE2 domain-containing protein [Altericista sp. CCNU0014]|uniref:CHASE2 domain-containing protein n=1 Tax=Altericista sp. CCNU0014 TaxID=3082949 RepID=UPI00384E0249
MTKAHSGFEYQFGGSLDGNAPSYVRRKADTELYRALKAGRFCYVLNSRQMGKSSLRVQTMQRLQQEGTVCIFIDLTGMGKQDVTPEKWYAGIVQSLVSGGQLKANLHWRTWWRERQDLFSPVQRLSVFIEEVLLVEIQQNIVIFVDEIDRVLSQSFSLDDFFVLIRFCLEQRSANPAYKRLTFALLGVATPNDLIRDKTQTPFNIGIAIELEGFRAREVEGLVRGLQGIVEQPEARMQEILDWTGGQPFLTQKLCYLVASASAIDPRCTVEQVVRSGLIDNWEFQDEPEHLRTIRDRILRNQTRVGRLLSLYRQILLEGAIASDGSQDQMELRLSGLVVERQGKLVLYNRLYESVFDLTWTDRKLAELRPYEGALAHWFASSCQDESSLLRGQVLQDALAWALGRSLGDRDYQFLGASQDFAKRKAQAALDATEQASRILALARQGARQEVSSRRLKWQWLPVIALAVTAPVLLLRFGGLFQSMEWNFLDQCFRWRSLERPDPRIAVVALDESDIAAVGQWPIPDRVLAQTIDKIKAQRPKSIGLDLYRNLPIEPGHSELVRQFNATPNLFGIEKAIGTRIEPPLALQQRQQIGFADQVLDADGKVRRALLSVSLSESDVSYSLALKLALHYLKAKGVAMESESGDRIRLGKAVLERFERNDGGYVRAESGGYQILLNFRGTEDRFPVYSLKAVLNGQVPLDGLRDRIVLIGTTADSLNDFFYTPYSSGLVGSPERMAGVILQANILSQILSAALEGRSLLRVWPEPMEWLWVLAWAGVGAALGWRWRSGLAIAFGVIATSGLSVAIVYVGFLLGWWLPAIPTLLAFWGTTATILIINNRQRDRLLFQCTLAKLLAEGKDYPVARRIALEYLKQSEPENRADIERYLT